MDSISVATPAQAFRLLNQLSARCLAFASTFLSSLLQMVDEKKCCVRSCPRRAMSPRAKYCWECFLSNAYRSGLKSGEGIPGNAGNANARGKRGNVGNAGARSKRGNIGNAGARGKKGNFGKCQRAWQKGKYG